MSNFGYHFFVRLSSAPDYRRGVEVNINKFRLILAFIIFNSSYLFSQEKIITAVDKPAQPIGGKLDVDYVFQSQVIYPADLLKKKVNADVAIYFTVLADGSIKDLEFKQEHPEGFKTEAKRLLRYFIFTPASVGSVNVASQSFLVFKIYLN